MERQRPIINANKIREAYIVEFSIDDDDENLRDVIAVRDTRAEKFYEIQGIDSPRPIENVKWQSNEVIVFDQWMNPTRSGRYAVNLRTKKLVGFGFLK
ncbi:MAG: hypothetical protein ABWZ66_09380 [Pyrinomonadaceae bacterium]